jgi:hypothetical protein
MNFDVKSEAIARLTAACLLAGLAGSPAAGAEPEKPAPAIVESPITTSDREHWAFQPIKRSEVPAVKEAARPRNDVDRFILAKLEAAGLRPLPEANRQTFIRRAAFDLTGLPPTPAEVRAFVDDESSDAHEKLLDDLLASSHYGERWAQHWLDLARYADTDGFEYDAERPNAWRYRDWVIDALNCDMPYDEFVRLQLAGDEIRPDDPAAIVATGFLLCGQDMPDINLQEERRHSFLNDLTGTVGATLLGLQVGCAACHDHKYDPVSQLDFYRLRAFFDTMEIFKDLPLPLDRSKIALTPAQEDQLARLRDAASAVAKIEEAARERLKAVNPDLQPSEKDISQELTKEEGQEHAARAKEVAQLRKDLGPAVEPFGRVVRETGANAKPSRLMIRGDFRRPGPELNAAFPRVLNVSNTSVSYAGVGGAAAETHSARQRTQLADWVVAPENPLAARVMVNRVWQFHFGRGLVETASDFGTMGSEPTHPELLDWLAVEFVREKWSLKRLHKLILMSAAYRQASRPTEPGWTSEQTAAAQENWTLARQADPDNRLLSRFPRQRLEGEAIRDAMLAAADRLSARRGGRGVLPPLPDELRSTLLKSQWIVSPNEEDRRRRSIYMLVRRNLRYPLFEAFDRPDANASCPRRNRSTTAPQALILLNSEFSLEAARDLAGYVLRQERGDPEDEIRLVYGRALSREPTADELRTAMRFLAERSTKLRDSRRPVAELALPSGPIDGIEPYAAAALTDLCLVIMNVNEFVYLD